MAVGNPYGRFAYGKGPYARATGRPYGIGPYGTGHYSRFAGNTFDVAGATHVAFSASAAPQHFVALRAASGIGFSLTGAATIELHPWAITSITLSLQARGQLSWQSAMPCGEGAWPPGTPCEIGDWQPVLPCEVGTWPLAPCEVGEWQPVIPCEAGTWGIT